MIQTFPTLVEANVAAIPHIAKKLTIGQCYRYLRLRWVDMTTIDFLIYMGIAILALYLLGRDFNNKPNSVGNSDQVWGGIVFPFSFSCLN